MCSQAPELIATHYCPELDCPLAMSSYEMLVRMPALKHISLVSLHEMEYRRRKDPTTGEPFTLYDVELQKPISTAAKFVGESKNHTVISLDEAATEARQALRLKMQLLQDRIASGRLAASQVEKLQIGLQSMEQAARQEMDEYFATFQERLARRRKQLTEELRDEVARRQATLRNFAKLLPDAVSVAQAAVERANEGLGSDDVELVLRQKELLLRLDQGFGELEIPGDIAEASQGVTFVADDRSIFLNDFCKMENKKDPEYERAVSMLRTLLGTPSSTVAASAPRALGESAPASAAALPAAPRPARPEEPRRETNPWRMDPGDERLAPAPATVTAFDPRFSDSAVQIDGPFAWRRVPQVTSAFALGLQFLTPGQRAEFRVEEVNVHLPGSGWIGMTSMRSLTSLSEEALYVNLADSQVIRQGQIMQEVGSRVVLSEGDVLACALLPGMSACFYVNHRQVCPPIQVDFDFAYPFLNLTGSLIRARLM